MSKWLPGNQFEGPITAPGDSETYRENLCIMGKTYSEWAYSYHSACVRCRGIARLSRSTAFVSNVPGITSLSTISKYETFN